MSQCVKPYLDSVYRAKNGEVIISIKYPQSDFGRFFPMDEEMALEVYKKLGELLIGAISES